MMPGELNRRFFRWEGENAVVALLRQDDFPKMSRNGNVGLGVAEDFIAYDPLVTFLFGKEGRPSDDPNVIPLPRQSIPVA